MHVHAYVHVYLHIDDRPRWHRLSFGVCLLTDLIKTKLVYVQRVNVAQKELIKLLTIQDYYLLIWLFNRPFQASFSFISVFSIQN